MPVSCVIRGRSHREVPGHVVLVMTSPSSGYVTIGRNGSETSANSPFLREALAVPPGHALMVSYQQQVSHDPCVKLFYRRTDSSIKKPFKIGYYTRDNNEFWFSNNPCDWNGASVFSTKNINVEVRFSAYSCSGENITACFQLFFSFFPENEAPWKLSSGFWNCSVEDYPRFQHHLECNLKTECEDERDETERCPFSNSDCQGLVALCAHCYKFVSSESRSADDANKIGDQHCNSLGGVLKLPTCLYDPNSMIMKQSKTYWNIPGSQYVGLYSKDMSLPNMYRHSEHHTKTVFFHFFQWAKHPYLHYTDRKYCVRLNIKLMSIMEIDCTSPSTLQFLCEFRTNKTDDISRQSRGISLPAHRLLTQKQYDITEHVGHVTYAFLLPGPDQNNPLSEENPFSYFSDHNSSNSLDPAKSVTLIPAFTCINRLTISFTLVCDFIEDCVDSSDESFCQHPLCTKRFTCKNGQCQPFEKVCDQISHCYDESDEQSCQVFFEPIGIDSTRFPSPALIKFNGVSQFSSVPMNSTESCPDSHYRCPGQFNDCLPVYTRCNGVYDCRDHEDEDECWEMKCPGFFQCRLSKVCLHSDHLCDGWHHCPKHDDELWCDMTCPVDCLCQGHTFLCLQRFRAQLYPLIRSLNATGTGMTLNDVSSQVYLIHLILVNCSLTRLTEMKWTNLKFLDFSYNKLQNINVTSFLPLENLLSLSLSNNPITSIRDDSSSAFQESGLRMLDLSYTSMTVFDSKVLKQFVRLQTLNLSFTSIRAVHGFQFTPQLTELFLDGTPVKTFPTDIFRRLLYLRLISAMNYKLCCNEMLPQNFDISNCVAPKDEISSCEDLLQSWIYRGFLWLIACLAVSGNVFCLFSRLCMKRMSSSSSFSVLVTHLTMGDLLMGVYMSVIGVADEQFRGRYLHHDDTWKSSVACKVAGFLAMLSSEVSALIICLITADRFSVICFPFSTLRFEKTSAAIVCILTWLVGWFLALLPLLPMTSHWQFYSQTGICIPLPVTRQEFKGKVYSFGVLIAFNFVLFLLISVGQVSVYWSIQKNEMKASSTKVPQDMTIARRLITIALTDFLCWFPIGLCGMLALAGFPIPGEINVALAIFILPLNSAINPFMYTYNTVMEKRRKSKEASFLKWVEDHPDVILAH